MFPAIFALLALPFGTLHPQPFHVVHPQLWQNMWSKTLPAQTGDHSPAQSGKRFVFQLDWIVTLGEGLCKSFLQTAWLLSQQEGGSRYRAINKEKEKGLSTKACVLGYSLNFT